MRRTRSHFAILSAALLCAVALAGCGGAKAKGPERDADPYIQPKGFTDETGSVKGLVVDEEFAPLKDAIVGFIDPYQATKTDEGGAFEIGLLKPGFRNLYVIHLGHKSAGKRIELKINEATEVTFILPVLPIEEPWIDRIPKSRVFGQEIRTTHPTVRYTNETTPHGWMIKDKASALEGLHLFARWTPSQSLSGGIKFDFGLGGSSSASLFFSVQGQPPLEQRIDRAGIETTFAKNNRVCVKEPCRLQWFASAVPGITQNSAADVGIMLEQSYTVWVSHFYRQPVPEFYDINA